jgi:hypothetical protein
MNLALKSLGRLPLETPSQPKSSLVRRRFSAGRRDGHDQPVRPRNHSLSRSASVRRPFVLAHEWAHLSGHGDEAEASAVGWLACMKGGPVLRTAPAYLVMETARAMPPELREKAVARLDPGVRADIDAIANRMLAQKPAVQRTTARVYDEYLKANRVQDGTASYGRALTLILSPPFRDALSTYTVSR